jgi:hypothetical protein
VVVVADGQTFEELTLKRLNIKRENEGEKMKDAVIVSAVRTPVGKAKRGGLATVRPDEMAATTIQELLKRTPNLESAEIEDVVFGCAFPEGEQGLNIARMIALRAGLPDTVPAETSTAIVHRVFSPLLMWPMPLNQGILKWASAAAWSP